MIKQRIICNVNTGKVTREFVEDHAPVWVDYEAQIENCKQRLSETDYAVVKIAEGVAAREDYADLLAERKALRERIGELEQLQREQMT